MAAMPFIPALETLRDLRTDQIVVTTMGAAREWPKLSSHPLDFHYIPSAMGQAPALGLGLALARPDREVIVLNGDGCMLMNLGCLVTLAHSGAANVTLVVIQNGIYEVTGGQATAAGAAADFAALGRAAGMASVVEFSTLEAWRGGAPAALRLAGPRLIVLRVAPVGAEYHLSPPGPMPAQLARFSAALNG